MINYAKRWRNTPYGRAKTLLHRYQQKDKKYNRGESDLTPEWIIENIFTQPCVHCGKTGWTVIGCNRLDNSKPHTKDNVEPCCKECNNKLACKYHKEICSKPIEQIDSKTGEVLRQWSSVSEAAKTLNYNEGAIRKCANGGYFLNGKWYNSYIYKNCYWKRL